MSGDMFSFHMYSLACNVRASVTVVSDKVISDPFCVIHPHSLRRDRQLVALLPVLTLRVLSVCRHSWRQVGRLEQSLG